VSCACGCGGDGTGGAGGKPGCRFTVATAGLVSNSLMGELIPIVDCIRDLQTELGNRPYRVRLVRTTWSTGVRGRGVESVVFTRDILPTPLVVDMTSLAEVVTAVGVNEQGTVQLQEISGRYTEDQLLGEDAVGNPPGPGDNIYFEITFYRRDGLPAELRRFVKQSAPYYKASGFQWNITLVQANETRNRDGTPRG